MEHLHQRIRADLESRIMSGEWPPGHRIPNEHALMVEYGCSRMTVNKVLSGLAVNGLIIRRRKTGSVVAAPSTERAVLEIQDFALEAARTGTIYRHEVLHRAVEGLDAPAAQRIGLSEDAEVLNVNTLHLMDDLPGAYEERLINLAAVPEVLEEHFEDAPPGSWLLQRVPWTDAAHVIRAINADVTLAERLETDIGAACLVLERRTWQTGTFITEARITYPGDRHHLIGHFSPAGGQRFSGMPGR